MQMNDQQEKMAKLLIAAFHDPDDAIPTVIDALLRLHNANDAGDAESAAVDFESAVDELHGDFYAAINADWADVDHNAEHVLGKVDLL